MRHELRKNQLLVTKELLLELTIDLQKRLNKVDAELKMLDVLEDQMLETADEVKKEMEDGLDV